MGEIEPILEKNGIPESREVVQGPMGASDGAEQETIVSEKNKVGVGRGRRGREDGEGEDRIKQGGEIDPEAGERVSNGGD